MMLGFAILISILIGLLSCHLFLIGRDNISIRFLVNLGFPIGIGFSSLIFIFFNLLGFSTLFTFCIEIIILVFLILKVKNIEKKIKPLEWINWNNLIQSPILLLVGAIYFYFLVMDAGIFFFDSIKEPHGLWDAWADWNLGAKFISRDPQGWTTSFQQMLSEDFHTDYPLLQKGFIARCWILAKAETVWVPIISAFVFTFCTIGLLSSAVRYFTNKLRGLIAGLILLATPFYMIMGDSQYADNTVGFFFLATVILMTLARNGKKKPILLIAAGITAGLSAWSKNEGLLFIACLFISQLPLLFFKNHRELIVEFKYLLFGMLPILFLIVYFKIAITPPSELIIGQGTQTFVKLTDYSRYVIVSKWFIEQFSLFGQWVINPWWFFLIGILYKGISLKENRNSIISNFTLFLLMLFGFFFIYIITPLDLIWHLNTSLHRLFFQLFPTFIFIYFLAVKVQTPILKPNSGT